MDFHQKLLNYFTDPRHQPYIDYLLADPIYQYWYENHFIYLEGLKSLMKTWERIKIIKAKEFIPPRFPDILKESDDCWLTYTGPSATPEWINQFNEPLVDLREYTLETASRLMRMPPKALTKLYGKNYFVKVLNPADYDIKEWAKIHNLSVRYCEDKWGRKSFKGYNPKKVSSGSYIKKSYESKPNY